MDQEQPPSQPDGWWVAHVPEPNPEPQPFSPPPPPPAPAPSSPPPPGAPPRTRARVGIVALVAGLIGAIVGGGIAGGLVLAFDGHDSTTIIRAGVTEVRPSSVLAKPGDIRAILAKVEPAVVRIDVTTSPDSIDSQSGTGTGFIVASNGIIVTNAHVANAETANAAAELVVTLSNGDSVRGRLIGEDRTQDLAVIKIERTGLPAVKLGDSDALQVGDALVAIGNALGIAGSPTVTSGIVSGLGRTVHIAGTETLVDAIQTDASINPGNSGGPLVDSNGRVIGINTAIADPSSSNNIGFAISISSAEPVLDDLRAGRTPRIAFMGVRTLTVTPRLVRQHHLSADAGAYVATVTTGTGAARAGLRTGDVMIEIDGERVSSNDDVIRIVRRHRPGESLHVVLLRDKTRKTYNVKLGDLPNA